VRPRRIVTGIGAALLTTALAFLTIPAASAPHFGASAEVSAIALVPLTLDNPGAKQRTE
jgi:hypothetical protein